MKSLYFCFKEKIVQTIRFFYAFLDDGSRCFICNKRSLFLPVCKSCIKKFYSVENAFSLNRCMYCGKELISTHDTCMKCRENRVIASCDYVMPLFSYRLWNKELLYHWKIEGNRSLSSFFSSLVKEALLKFLEKMYGFRVLKILQRCSLQEQKKLNRQERLETIKSAYSLLPEAAFRKELQKNKGIIPEKVCLLDDVCTTGSTIECCAQILKKAGIKKVGVITLFTVD